MIMNQFKMQQPIVLGLPFVFQYGLYCFHLYSSLENLFIKKGKRAGSLIPMCKQFGHEKISYTVHVLNLRCIQYSSCFKKFKISPQK